jgi:hypothetical protein
MENPEYLLAILSALVIILCLGVFFIFFSQLRRKNDPRSHTQSDLTNMMILFQTMRDVVSEQKALARDFNASLDRKVEAIRSIVQSAQREREELRKTQQAIVASLNQVKSDLLGDEGQGDSQPRERPTAVSATNSDVDRAEESAEPESASPALEDPVHALEDPVHAPEDPGHAPEDPLYALGDPDSDSDPVDDLINSWAGAEFIGAETTPAVVPPVVEAPTAPEDAAAARDAFRMLLDIDSGLSGEAAPSPNASRERPLPTGGANGKPRLSPLQRRVYEYSDAGMKVGDIAKELGIGKGEIRLIQSLRKAEDRS